MALTQSSFDQYGPEVDSSCLVLIDSALTIPEGLKAKNVVSLPILETARNKVGRLQTANIVAVGAINALVGITDDETISKAVLMHVPKGTEELNMKALVEGKNLAEQWSKENKK